MLLGTRVHLPVSACSAYYRSVSIFYPLRVQFYLTTSHVRREEHFCGAELALREHKCIPYGFAAREP